jgi:hypothetical protein
MATTHGTQLIDSLRIAYDVERTALTKTANETMDLLHTVFDSLLFVPIEEYRIIHSYLSKFGAPRLRIGSKTSSSMSVSNDQYNIDIGSNLGVDKVITHYISIDNPSEKFWVECVVSDLRDLHVYVANYERLLADHKFVKLTKESVDKHIRKNSRCGGAH